MLYAPSCSGINLIPCSLIYNYHSKKKFDKKIDLKEKNISIKDFLEFFLHINYLEYKEKKKRKLEKT